MHSALNLEAEWVYHSLSSQNVEDFIKEMGGVVSSAKAVHKTLQGKLRLILFIIIWAQYKVHMGYCTISKLNFWFKMNCSVGFLSPMSCFAPSCSHAAFFEASESFCSVVAAVGSKASNLPGGVRRLGELSMHTVDTKLLVVYVVVWVKGVGEWTGQVQRRR